MRMDEITLKNPDSPATSNQTWTLKKITGKDYRNKGLTQQQASDLITQHIGVNKGGTSPKKVSPKSKKPVKSIDTELFAYLKKNAKRLANVIKRELGITAHVVDDPKWIKNPKSYCVTHGGGYGFAWIKYDKRNPAAKLIDDAASRLKSNFKDWVVMSHFKHADLKGVEIVPLVTQSMVINMEYEKMILDFMKLKGVKKAQLMSRMDESAPILITNHELAKSQSKSKCAICRAIPCECPVEELDEVLYEWLLRETTKKAKAITTTNWEKQKKLLKTSLKDMQKHFPTDKWQLVSYEYEVGGKPKKTMELMDGRALKDYKKHYNNVKVEK